MPKIKLKKDVVAVILLILVALFGYIIPITLTLGNQELSNPDIAFQINIFSTILTIGLLVVAGLYFTRKIWRQDNKYGDGFGFFNIGKFPSFPIFEKLKPFQITLLGIIIFSGFFLLNNIINFLRDGAFGLSVLPQQFSNTEALVFSTLLIPISEEMLALAVTGIFVLVLVVLSVVFNVSKRDFRIYYLLVIPVLIGLVALIWHNNVYAASDLAQTTVVIFWILKTFLILVTGFFVVGVIFHMANNFFIDFTRLFSDDLVRTVTIAIVLGLTAWYIWLYVIKPKRRK